MTIAGLMQPKPLLISDILGFAAIAHPTREIVSRQIDEPIARSDYARLACRAGRLAGALGVMGVRPGERVATLAWNTIRHLELFYAVPGLGAVLNTVNPRLFEDQIAYILEHAEVERLFVEPDLVQLVERLAPRVPGLRDVVVLCAAERLPANSLGAISYEALLDGQTDAIDWPVLDENAGAFLCYTSGTTGDPKGVLYSHRAVVLHALAAGLSGAMHVGAFDVVMPCSSMCHATAWGMPFVAPINGAKLVLPGNRMDGASLAELIDDEGVTLTGGVPTIWTGYLEHLARVGGSTGALQRVIIGGSAVPRAMAEAFKQRHGVETLQLWGMTETTPVGVTATPTPALAARGEAHARDVIWTRQGRRVFGIEVRVDAPAGQSGPLQVRGPWVIQRYFRGEADAVDADGWFDTGDIAEIDADGYVKLTDRAKDVIKSGGEWISSIDLENIAAAAPGVRVAAVIGIPDAKWEERPLLIVEPHEGAAVDLTMLRDHLARNMAKWWLPERIEIAAVPLTATGKIDKKRLRERYR